MRSSRSVSATSRVSPSFPDSGCPVRDSLELRHFCSMTTRFCILLWWASLAYTFAQAQDKNAPASEGGYALVVETEPAHQPGLTRYILSLALPESDRVSSIFGTDVYPLTINAPKGAFNSPYNGSWSASGMNPKFFEIMPDMGDDTFATIGLTTGAKISGLEGAEDPTMVQDPGAPWDSFFTTDGETTMSIDTHTGGAWFVLRTASNGAPQGGKVLLMQVTTAGSVSGSLNIQIFPGSEDYDQVQYRFEFDGKGEFSGMAIE